MKQTAFEQLHGETWASLETMVKELEARRVLPVDQQQNFAALFRKVCHLHALAHARHYSSFLVDHLGDLVDRAHRQMYRRRYAIVYPLLRFVWQEFPALVRSEVRFVAVATALFVVPLILLLVSTLVAPEFVYTVLAPDQASQMADMYNPANRVLGQARDSDTNWGMFGFYIQNNISVAFRTFASGLLLGLGSGFFLIYNGALIGAVSGHLINLEYSTSFMTFVIGHGSFELTAIVLAGAAGLRLGYSLLAPGQCTRLVSLMRAAKIAVQMVYGVILMLLIAAFIEAFWSSNNLFDPWVKYTVGGCLWAVVLAYLLLVGRAPGDAAQPGAGDRRG